MGRLGDYWVLRVLESGGMGVVFEDQRLADGLRKHPTLKMIGGRPATQYWKEFDERKKNGK